MFKKLKLDPSWLHHEIAAMINIAGPRHFNFAKLRIEKIRISAMLSATTSFLWGGQGGITSTTTTNSISLISSFSGFTFRSMIWSHYKAAITIVFHSIA